MRKGSSLTSFDPYSPGNASHAGRHGGAQARRRSLGSCLQGCGRPGGRRTQAATLGWFDDRGAREVTTRPPRRDTSPHQGARDGGRWRSWELAETGSTPWAKGRVGC